jgi:hypothetical protein
MNPTKVLLCQISAKACGFFKFFFLDKEYILISSRYQLHPASATTQCPSGNTDAHSQKKEEEL